jgi:hypothetical protein
LISSFWSSAYAFAGASAKLEVRTALVGNGAKIQITGKSEGGKKLGKIKDVINNNVFVSQLDIPEDTETGDEIYFEVKLSKNSLDGESNRIPVYPQPKIKSIGWRPHSGLSSTENQVDRLERRRSQTRRYS